MLTIHRSNIRILSSMKREHGPRKGDPITVGILPTYLLTSSPRILKQVGVPFEYEALRV